MPLDLPGLKRLHADPVSKTMTLRQLTVLAMVGASSGRSIGEYAKELVTNTTGISRAVSGLEEDEMVSRSSDPTDLRLTIVKLTPAGAAFLRRSGLMEGNAGRATAPAAPPTPAAPAAAPAPLVQ